MALVGVDGVKVELLGIEAMGEEGDVTEVELADIGARELDDILEGTASHFLSLNTSPMSSSSSSSVSEASPASRRILICSCILLPATQWVSRIL